MESTKVALESERRIQVLQMQAINALWKKVSSMQTGQGNAITSSTNGVANVSTGKNGADLANLAETCNLMHNQVRHSSFFCVLSFGKKMLNCVHS